jgi:DMSO/TMAO reductase YedYZ molybdopterin-dependent catalytic subunit
MKRTSLLIVGLLGGLTAVVLIALTYLGNQLFGFPFVPFDIFDWMARHLPGGLINFVIDTMVKVITALRLGPTASTAKLVEETIALVQFVILGILIGLILWIIGRRRPDKLVLSGMLAGAVVCAGIIFIETTLQYPSSAGMLTLGWLALIFLGWAAVLGRLIRELAIQPLPSPQLDLNLPKQDELSRRQFLYLVGAGSFAIMVSAAGFKIFHLTGPSPSASQSVPTPDLGSLLPSSGAASSPEQSALAARFVPVPGTRPELTPNDQFYRIDIDTTPPEVNGDTWRLDFVGLVDKPLSLSLADLKSRRAISQAITLECISNEVGGDLISTSIWTGVPLKDLIAEVGLKPGVQEIAISSADGFYESVPVAQAMDERIVLVYQMNGQPLPVEHGFPLRIYIPNHYGMKQPKWITRLEAIVREGTGYWVDRGWSVTAYVQTTSVVDSVAVDQKDPQTGVIPIGGIAYAGSRGISKVEVQVDEGAWEVAELRNPPLSPLTWVQWRYAWKSSPGRHTVQVRAYDGEGVLQVTDQHSTYPNGATGIDSVNTNVIS